MNPTREKEILTLSARVADMCDRFSPLESCKCALLDQKAHDHLVSIIKYFDLISIILRDEFALVILKVSSLISASSCGGQERGADDLVSIYQIFRCDLDYSAR